MAAPSGQLKVSRYFLALAAIVALIYGLLFFTGTTRTPRLGLDLQGGTTVTLKAVTKNGKAPSKDSLTQARIIIERRVNGTGVAEAEVVTQGNNQIVVSVPGRQKITQLASTAQLRFRQVIQSAPGTAAAPPASPAPAAPTKSPATVGGSPSPAKKRVLTSALLAPTPSATATPSATPSPGATPNPSASATGPTAADFAELARLPAQTVFAAPQISCAVLAKRPPGSIADEKKQVVACSADGQTKYLLDVAKVLGTDVSNADYQVDSTSGQWKVVLSFKGKGQDRWTNLTRAAVGKPSPTDQVAIVLDADVVSAPVIQSVITGNAEITGQFSQAEAKTLANQLKYGALPLTFDVLSEQAVSPTLGTDQLKAGLLAGGIGLVLVALYSLIYYRILGLVTISSLLLSGLVTYGLIVLLGRRLGFTLSLAGIAGFIVAVGITADSFVVFFERLKDEVKDGRSVRSAVPRAWVRARRTILSADAVSFLAAAALYVFTVGAVKGFAFTLGLSTLLDLLIVFLFTHPLVSLTSRWRTFDSPRMTGLGNVRHHDPVEHPREGVLT
ncbi:MAG: protein translocase subunit SecD [Pseudonocardiales bacterium]